MAQQKTTPVDGNHNLEFELRKEKRAALIAEGYNPYGHAFAYSHHSADIEASYGYLADGETTDEQVSMCGRITTKRCQGKISFFTLLDSTGKVQLLCRMSQLGEHPYANMKALDIGDWVGVRGCIMRTRRGQLSVAVESFELLSKALRPVPADKKRADDEDGNPKEGLQDKELCYRHRELDLIANPSTYKRFQERFKIVSACRRYMEDNGFYEAETPFLHAIIGGANAKPFETHFNALDRDYYLRIATELPLKRLLVGGFERVFELGRQFRNEGMDPYHNPEFTTMEAYQAFADLDSMKTLTQGLIRAAALSVHDTLDIEYQGQVVHLGDEWRSATMIELIEEKINAHIGFDLSREDLTAIAENCGVSLIEETWGKGRIINEIFEAVVEKDLIQPTFVCEHPIEISPLAKKYENDPNVADRFELFICGHEYANAFNELNDPVEQAERFRAQVAAKNMGDDEAMGYDSDYIQALEYGMPPAGGVGIGIDRLVMLLTNSGSIRDVLLFPHMRNAQA